MADPRFFRRMPPINLHAIAAHTGAEVDAAFNAREVSDVAPLDAAGPEHISFFDNVKYIEQFKASKAGACFIKPRYAKHAPEGMVLLSTPEPYAAFGRLSLLFYPNEDLKSGIHPSAHIDATATIGENVRIDAGAWIGPRAEIGARCHIGANAVITDGVVIGEDSKIGPVTTVSHSIIGKRVLIHRGSQIGQDGFGFAPTKQGLFKMPQLGRVIIGNDVEIGSCTCIDRGSGPDTVIHDGAKIDNLVQIGHNCTVGKFAVIVGQVGLAGSTHVGDGAMLGGQVGIGGHVTIGAGARLAAKSGVAQDIPAGVTYGGTPAMPINQWRRQVVVLEQLGKQKGGAASLALAEQE